MKMLHEINQTESKNCEFEFGQPILCILDEGKGSNMIKQQFIGFYLNENQDYQNKLHRLDHWEKMEGSRNDLCWTNPKLSDIQIVKEEQILPENVNGSWYLSGKNQWFQQQNVEKIPSFFRNIYNEIR